MNVCLFFPFYVQKGDQGPQGPPGQQGLVSVDKNIEFSCDSWHDDVMFCKQRITQPAQQYCSYNACLVWQLKPALRNRLLALSRCHRTVLEGDFTISVHWLIYVLFRKEVGDSLASMDCKVKSDQRAPLESLGRLFKLPMRRLEGSAQCSHNHHHHFFISHRDRISSNFVVVIKIRCSCFSCNSKADIGALRFADESLQVLWKG